jgi:hypothetical protein
MRFCTLLCVLFAVVGISAAQDSNFSAGPQYLMNFGSPMFLRPIATPTLSLSETNPASLPATEPVTATETSSASAGSQSQAGLTRIYWGGQPETSEAVSETASVIEISGTQPPSNLPASIVNVGVQETVDAQALRERGYGVTVSEASSFWKTHKPHAVRVFTNRDVERLHGG